MANANTAAAAAVNADTSKSLPHVAEALSMEALAKLNIPGGVLIPRSVVESIYAKLSIACMLIVKGHADQSTSGFSLLHDLSDRQKLDLAMATEVQTLFRDRISTKRKALSEVVEVSTKEYCDAVLNKELKRISVMSEQDKKQYLKEAAAAFVADAEK